MKAKQFIEILSEKYKEQLKKGIKVEAEHKRTYQLVKAYVEKYGELPPEREFYLNIAKDHLIEYSDYYDRLLAAKL
jgi:hypothetical protein